MGYSGISECEDLELYSVDIIFDKIGSIVLSDTQYSLGWLVSVALMF